MLMQEQKTLSSLIICFQKLYFLSQSSLNNFDICLQVYTFILIMANGISIGSVLLVAAAAGLGLAKFSQLSTSLAIIVTYATIVPLYIVVYCSWIWPVYLSPLKDIPTVPGFPLWGSFLEIITTECGLPQRKWHKAYGPSKYFNSGSKQLGH